MAWPLAIECLRRIAALGAGEGQPSSLFTSQEENCAGHAVLHVEQRVQKRLFFQSFRDESFPEKLRTLEHDDQAGFLFALGNLALLDTASVGICGSRHA